MVDLENIFQNFLEKEELQNKKLLLMVSGGVDSMVLLYLAIQKLENKDVFVFHLDHNSRKDSHKDALFVQNYCSLNNIACHVDKLPQSIHKNKECNWRKARQELSTAYAKKVRAERIITAHHGTDLVETMLYRMVKGTGPAGLSPFDISTKPLWQVSKSDIFQYAQDNGIEFMEDASNQDTSYARNRIRQNILPELREITPNLEKVFVKEATIFSQLSDFLDTHLQNILPENQQIALNDFLQLTDFEKRLLLQHIASTPTSFDEVEDTLKWLEGSPEGGTNKEIGNSSLLLEKGVLSW